MRPDTRCDGEDVRGVLDPFPVPVARPHPDALATAKPVVANPHDGLGAVIGSPHAGRLDHAPASAGLGEDRVGIVVHLGEPSARLPLSPSAPGPPARRLPAMTPSVLAASQRAWA